MDRWTDVGDVPDSFGPSVVTIGNFDGVHLGHRAVLAHLVARAHDHDAAAVAVTFDPHPLQVLRPDQAPAAITSIEHKLQLIASTGVDAVLLMPFTLELASWSPERFVADVLVDRLHISAVVVGHDIRFGHRNAGDLSTMQALGEQHGFAVEVMDNVTSPGGSDQATTGQGRRWSSSWARELISAGDVAAAADVLGRPHRVVGEVVHGDHRGRELGYPTANLGPDSTGLVPADGVYAGWVVRLSVPDDPDDPQLNERLLPGAISVGTNPTFDGTARRVEAYVLDRTDLELYGEHVAVEFVSRLRDTLRFDGVDALVVQMARDVERCREVLGVAAPAP